MICIKNYSFIPNKITHWVVTNEYTEMSIRIYIEGGAVENIWFRTSDALKDAIKILEEMK